MNLLNYGCPLFGLILLALSTDYYTNHTLTLFCFVDYISLLCLLSPTTCPLCVCLSHVDALCIRWISLLDRFQLKAASSWIYIRVCPDTYSQSSSEMSQCRWVALGRQKETLLLFLSNYCLCDFVSTCKMPWTLLNSALMRALTHTITVT